MTVHHPVAACGTARPFFGLPGAAVIVVILVLAGLVPQRGTPLPEASTVLAGAGLFAVAVVRLRQGRFWESAALRCAGRMLLTSGQT
ncbi:hypothetical protein [Streptomyces sp. NPDC045470]|uniref:hypothetical protein n=1 Tax=Streptomyces sp. NPDC045470 TaxID=3155469 RepID=UPI0033F13832